MMSPYNEQNQNGRNWQNPCQSQASGSNPFIVVPSVYDVEKVVVQANETKWFMIQNDYAIAVKTADAIGYSNTKYYKLVEFKPTTIQQPSSSGTEYITAAQLDEKLNNFASQIVTQLQSVPANKTVRTKEN